MYHFQEQELGPLRVFELPEPGMIYTMGVDASTGLAEDYSVAQIVTNTIPFTQVAVFRAKIAVNRVTEYVDMLGRFYNEALNVCEINYPGNSIQDALLESYNYPRNYRPEQHLDIDPSVSDKFGFRTTESTKWMLIQMTQMMLETHEVLVNDPVTLSELLNFVYQAKKKQAAAAAGFTDDCVMALMFALHGAHLYPHIRLGTKKKAVKESVDPDTRRDWRLFKKRLMGLGHKKQGIVL